MSEVLLSNLRRFDEIDDPNFQDRLNLLVGKVPLDEPNHSGGEAERVPEEINPQANVKQSPMTDVMALETTLEALSDTISLLKQEANSQSVEVVQSLASKLFPELSDLFLAEEIGRHLPALIPQSVPEIELRAEPAQLVKIQQLLETKLALRAHLVITPLEHPSDSRVQISWKTGGISFDFDGLLDACLARLNSTQET